MPTGTFQIEETATGAFRVVEIYPDGNGFLVLGEFHNEATAWTNCERWMIEADQS